MLGVAFKEWAAVCKALADGRQALILRKGGIAEDDGSFRPEHPRFWLYPTYFHEQQQTGLKPDARPLLDAAGADRPAPGTIDLTHVAEVGPVRYVTDLDAALRLDGLHVWAADTVRQRFHYRKPGLFVLPVRLFRARTPVVVPEHPAYAGCKTWVTLDAAANDEPADPVLTDAEWADRLLQIETAITGPTGQP